MPNPSGSVRAAQRLRRAHAKSESPSLWRRAAAVLTTLALAGGLAVVGAAAPASAHTGDLKAKAVCNTETGMYDVTYTLELTQVGNGLTGSTEWRVGTEKFEGTPSSAKGMDRGPITSTGNATITLEETTSPSVSTSLPGDTRNGPWVYAYTQWDDGYGKGSDGRIEGLAGDCSAPATSKVSGEAKCAADGTTTIVWTVTTTGAKPGDEADAKVIKPVEHWLNETADHKANHGLEPLRPDDVIRWEQTNVSGKSGDVAKATFQIDWKQSGSTDVEGEVVLSDCAKPATKVMVPAKPLSQDLCGVANDQVLTPAPVTGVVWTISPIVDGRATAIATTLDGYVFDDGTSTTPEFPFLFTDAPCDTSSVVEPTLDGSVAVGECEADVPWISYAVVLTDPDNKATSDLVTLTLGDGTNSEVLELGELGADGTLSGKVLWPGASIDDGGNAAGWPGWEQLADGTWQETDGNFAWTRAITTAVIHVNPDLSVALSYPPATPDCANGPTIVPTAVGDGAGDGASTVAGDGTGLASTGFAGTTIAIVAGIIVLAGAAFLVIARVRRKRA